MKNNKTLLSGKFSWFLSLLVISFASVSFLPIPNNEVPFTEVSVVEVTAEEADLARKLSVYDSLGLEKEGLPYEAFEYAIRGQQKLIAKGTARKSSILSIADFSQPSANKRFYIVDLDNYKLLFKTWVAHGRNSGKDRPFVFSNKMSSNQSSLGFYVTAETYNGGHGYSLRLEGMEPGINDNARDRAIVMHAADYVNPKLVKTQGYIGRSLGCPAILPSIHKPVINLIKGGSCLFIYHPSKQYLSKSSLLS